MTEGHFTHTIRTPIPATLGWVRLSATLAINLATATAIHVEGEAVAVTFPDRTARYYKAEAQVLRDLLASMPAAPKEAL